MLAKDMQPTDEACVPPVEGEEQDRFRTVSQVRREVFAIYREAKSRKRPVPEAYSLVQILQTGAKLMEQERDSKIAQLEAKIALLEQAQAASQPGTIIAKDVGPWSATMNGARPS
jgi:hypothetical protein